MKHVSEAKTIEDGTKRVVMAIREEMMMYFKGTCIDRLTGNAGIRTIGISLTTGNRRPYLYERQGHEQASPRRLYFGETALGEVRHSSDTMSFYPAVMNRSPEFKAIRAQVATFFGKYLQGVQLNEDATSEYNAYVDGGKDKLMLREVAEMAMNGQQGGRRSIDIPIVGIGTPGEWYQEYTNYTNGLTTAADVPDIRQLYANRQTLRTTPVTGSVGIYWDTDSEMYRPF